jgi:chromosome segregation ATPase
MNDDEILTNFVERNDPETMRSTIDRLQAELAAKERELENQVFRFRDACINYHLEVEKLRKELAEARTLHEKFRYDVGVLEDKLDGANSRAERAEAEVKRLMGLLDGEEADVLIQQERAERAEVTRDYYLEKGAAAVSRAERAEARERALREASDKLGAWMSAALDDPTVCEEMRRDIREWFAALNPSPDEPRR